MRPATRKASLSVHLAVSVGWIGAALAYIVLAIAAATSDDVVTVRAAWIAMDVAGWYAIVPLAIASLVTGVVVALGSTWGVFRHYWVTISLGVTAFSTAVLLFHMPDVSDAAALARAADARALRSLGSDLAHPVIGTLILVGVLVLNVYKPAGLTRYGWRRQHDRGRSTGGSPTPGRAGRRAPVMRNDVPT